MICLLLASLLLLSLDSVSTALNYEMLFQVQRRVSCTLDRGRGTDFLLHKAMQLIEWQRVSGNIDKGGFFVHESLHCLADSVASGLGWGVGRESTRNNIS